MFNLILFGPPGSGKGTQSENIIRAYQLTHISTGDILRDEVSRQTALGLEARKYMDNGRLVPDEVVIGMIGAKISENPDTRGFIFDGFPRTEAQAVALDRLLAGHQTSIDLLLSLEVPEAELKERLLKRGRISGRSDDNEAVIAKRIAEYKEKTEAVATYYDKQSKLKRIQGDLSIPETFGLIREAVDSCKKAV